MFLKKNKKNLRSLFNVFAVFGLAITALWWGANTSTINAQVVRGTLFDFSGEGRTDFTTLRFNENANIIWNIVVNPVNPLPNQGIIRRFAFGFAGDAMGVGGDSVVPRDYRGDNKTEVAVWRRTNAVYYLAQFPAAPNTGIMLDRAVPFGTGATDNPGAEGDYDGDGKIDYTLVRNVGGTLNWFILSSGTNTFKAIPFGRTGVAGTTGTALFQGADFNGDGRDELVFVNRNSGNGNVNYYIGDSNTGVGVITKSFGNWNTDFNVTPADYTGDGRADFVAVRQQSTAGAPQIWYINNSVTNVTTATAFGRSDPTFEEVDDVPVRGDYDGDRRHDIAIYRASNRTFYYIGTNSGGSFQGQEAGLQGETPLGSFGLY
ncbi:MAG: VCBS repeat-containing protein [Acidobacteriota bacterium]|nr:VCBS repeat-containing protein [Acidobacteriota bacterium]